MAINFSELVRKFKQDSKNPNQEILNFIDQSLLAIGKSLSEVSSTITKEIQQSSEKQTRILSEVIEENDIIKLDASQQNIFTEISESLSAIHETLIDGFKKQRNSIGVDGNILNTVNPEHDNFQSPEEIMADNSKLELEKETEQVELAKLQLETLQEIRDSLKEAPRVGFKPMKSDKIDTDLIGINAPLIDFFPTKFLPNIIASQLPTPEKMPRRNSIFGAGIKAALVGGAAFNIYSAVRESGKTHDEKIAMIDQELESGAITLEEANKLKVQVENEQFKEISSSTGESIGMLAGASVGAKVGGAVGSVLGPLGAGVGAVGGAVVGGIAGTEFGRDLGESFADFLSSNEKTIDLVQEKIEVLKKEADEVVDSTKKFIETNIITGKEFDELTQKVTTITSDVTNSLKKSLEDMPSVTEMYESAKSKIASILPTFNFRKELEKASVEKKEVELDVKTEKDSTQNIISNVVNNNQSTQNIVPVKPTPRPENSGSALDRYVDKITRF